MMRSVTRLESWLLCAACCVFAAPALAVDGVLEINQACVATGCFPGDAPGFPVRIPAPGSYRLTSDLDVTGEPIPQDVTAIEIPFTSNVKIDLNGFSIIGPGTSGIGDGIDGFPNAQNVTVVNGAVRGMGRRGIDVDRRARIEGVTVENNGGAGIQLIGGSGYTDNVVNNNTGGTIVGGVEMGTNVCDTDTTCP